MDFFEVEVERLEAFHDYLTEVSRQPAVLAAHLATHVCTATPYGVGALAPIGDFMAGRAADGVARLEVLARRRVEELAAAIDACAQGYDTAELASLRLVAGVGSGAAA